MEGIRLLVRSNLDYYNETDAPWIFGCGYARVDRGQYLERDVSIFKNYPPETPTKPSMPSPVQVGIAVECQTSSLDPDGNLIWIKFDWGDGEGDYGEPVQSHFYTQPGIFNVRAKAMDNLGGESLWSESFTVTVIGSVPPQPTFTHCSLGENGLISLLGAGTARLTYRLQCSTDLVEWMDLETVVASSDGTIACTANLNDPSASAAFFRFCWP
jgi:hypothetical protein